MARVKFAGSEVDQQFQIEDGIRTTLTLSKRAAVSKNVIADSYDLLDDDFEPVEGTFEQKCDALAGITNATYTINDENVVFLPKTNA
ncbi:hypothetical protein BH11PLA2_BH11PLA2_09330 [soil metagenome]